MAKYSKARVEEIRDHLTEQARRGVSVAQYAGEIGVSVWTLYGWKKRFGACAGRGAGGRAGRLADLIEIDRAPVTSAIEIVTSTLTVRVPPGCAPDDLEHVLQAVLSC